MGISVVTIPRLSSFCRQLNTFIHRRKQTIDRNGTIKQKRRHKHQHFICIQLNRRCSLHFHRNHLARPLSLPLLPGFNISKLAQRELGCVNSRIYLLCVQMELFYGRCVLGLMRVLVLEQWGSVLLFIFLTCYSKVEWQNHLM